MGTIGSTDALADVHAGDPYPVYERLREREPVYLFGTGSYLLTRYTDCQRVLVERECFRAPGGHGPSGRTVHRPTPVLSRVMSSQNPPRHTRMRTAVARRFVEHVRRQQPWLLVHNAAVAEPGTIADASLDVWQRIFAVNLFSAAELTRLLLPSLRHGRGHVVLINAGSGLRIKSNRGPYAASKYALRAFADALQTEEKSNGVRVTSIHPGPTDTELQRKGAERAGHEYRPEQFLRPESVAAIVLNAVRAPADATVTNTVID
jgi:NAD(P)-dependent dehydrogenase (short-subunit alcohol dehydrogenase family)